MTPESQIKALAELDGWIYEPAGKDSFGVPYHPFWRHPHRPGIHHLPDYLHSYDAIIPLIQKQTKELTMPMSIDDYLPVGVYFHNATPSQLSEALLRATGKWKE